MDYLQERVTTLHDLTDPRPDAPVGDSAVVVPIAGESVDAVTPDYVFGPLSDLCPAEVVVPLRAPADVTAAFRDWIAAYDLPTTSPSTTPTPPPTPPRPCRDCSRRCRPATTS